jgi:hypothetical protein
VDALDRAGSRPHAVGDVRTLECRSGGGGTAPEATAVREADLGIGADVEREHGRTRLGGLGCEQHRDVVGADEAGDQRR